MYTYWLVLILLFMYMEFVGNSCFTSYWIHHCLLFDVVYTLFLFCAQVKYKAKCKAMKLINASHSSQSRRKKIASLVIEN